MSTRMLIDARHPEETRVTVVKGSRVEDFDYESSTRRQLKGNIYLARVTRVEPSLQAAFVEYGGNRHGFLAFSEIHPDYYQIPLEDREAIIEAETQAAAAEKAAEDDAEEAASKKRKPRRRRGRKPAAEKTADTDATVSEEAPAETGESSAGEGTPSDPTLDPEQDTAETEEVQNNTDTDIIDGETSDADGDEATDGADVKESDEEDKEAEIEAAAASRRRNLRALKRRYSIQEVIKRRQVLLIQVVKEERGNKGAALTTYMSLAGRYCVLMPNSTHSGGISRKISNLSDRKKLKQIIGSLNVPEDMGLIVRTAGINRTKTEIKRDYDYLLRLWNGIRDLTLKSTAPALIYEEGNLIKRTIRDVYTRDIDEIWVEGEKGYRAAKDFMKLLMPSHAKKVQSYKDRIPLYHRYQVENQLEAMYQPVVQLKSGGYLVINPTEALISIDVNSGRATKEHNIEETAVKTNLEAAEEVARQLRLRDMAGLVVIDFIDMEDRSNNRAVERRMKEVLKNDRARIQVGRISSFGLMEMSRQRLRPNLLEVAMETCSHCAGTGLVRSVESASIMALRQLEEEGIRNRSSVVRVNANPDVAIYLLNQKRSVLSELERQYNMTIQILAETSLGASDIEITRETGVDVNTASPNEGVVVKMDSHSPDAEPEKVQEKKEIEGDDMVTAVRDDQPRKKRRRRRRRRRGGGDDNEASQASDQNRSDDATAEDNNAEATADTAAGGDEPPMADGNARRRRGSRGGRRRRGRDESQQDVSSENTDEGASSTETKAEPASETSATESSSEEAVKAEKPTRRRRRVKKTEDADAAEAKAESPDAPADSEATEEKKPAKRAPRRRAAKKDTPKDTPDAETSKADVKTDAETEEKPKPRRRRKKAEKPANAEVAKSEVIAGDAAEEKAEQPKRRRTPAKRPAAKKADGVDGGDAPKAAKAPRKRAAAKPKETAAEVKTEVKAAPPAKTPEAPAVASGQASTDPNIPKKKGWWQRTFG